MKNTKLFAITALLAAFLLSACKNGLTGEATVKGDGITAGSKLNISITTNENLKIFKTQNSSRTLTTDAFDATNTDLKYYLWGSSTSNDTLDPKLVDVTSDDGINGTVVLDIEALNWDLTLAVVDNDATLEGTGKEDDIKAAAVLIGYANVDMQFTNSINFTLSPKGLTKKGSIGLRLVRENDWVIPAGYEVTANLYNATDMSEVDAAYNQILVDTDHTTDTFIKNADYADSATANYTANDKEIAPGTYVFEVRLTNTDDNRKYVWNDTIIVLPGKETDQITSGTGNLTKKIVIPNLIGKRPVSPANFKVTYKENEDAPATDYYTAEFTWDGTAVKTEKNFVIELAELGSTQATPDTVDNTNWNTLWTDAKAKYTFDYNAMNNAIDPETGKTNPNYDAYYNRFKAEGSLLANNSSITLYLELGKRYIARMYSENNAGYSNVSEADATKTADELAAYMNVQDDSDGNKYVVINRYRVTYHTQSDTAAWNEGADKFIPAKVYYWGQSNKAYDVIAPTGTGANPNTGSTTAPWLHDGAADWLYWIEDPQTQTKYAFDSTHPYDPDDYEGFANLDLYAAYSRNGTILIYDDNDYDILSDWVAGFGINKGDVSKTSTNEFSKGTLEDTKVSVTIPAAAAADASDPTKTWIYDKVLFTMTYGGRTYVSQEQNGADRGNANEFTIKLKTLPTGCVYNCKITAHYKQTVVSYPFTVYITD